MTFEKLKTYHICLALGLLMHTPAVIFFNRFPPAHVHFGTFTQWPDCKKNAVTEKSATEIDGRC